MTKEEYLLVLKSIGKRNQKKKRLPDDDYDTLVSCADGDIKVLLYTLVTVAGEAISRRDWLENDHMRCLNSLNWARRERDTLEEKCKKLEKESIINKELINNLRGRLERVENERNSLKYERDNLKEKCRSLEESKLSTRKQKKATQKELVKAGKKIAYNANVKPSDVKQLREKGWTLNRIAAHYGVSRGTIERRLKE